VTCANPTEALARARRAAVVRDATLFGNTLHVLAVEDLAADALLAELAAGDATASIRPVAPTLEDVFVTLAARSRAGGTVNGFLAILLKEFAHIRRDRERSSSR